MIEVRTASIWLKLSGSAVSMARSVELRPPRIPKPSRTTVPAGELKKARVALSTLLSTTFWMEPNAMPYTYTGASTMSGGCKMHRCVNLRRIQLREHA